jgi:hypothetical protein
MDNKKKDFIKFQNRRRTINLCKMFLVLFEDIKDGGDSISEDQYQKLRKRVLDYGNDSIREFEESVDSFS